MMKNKAILIFSFLLGLIVIAIALAIVLFAASSDNEVEFPQYAYRDYIDRSESMIFKGNAGAQLYEAESAVLSGGAYATDNGMASGRMVADGLKEDGAVKFRIEFDKSCTVRLVFSLCYVSTANRAISARNLFAVYLNSKEQNVRKADVSNCYNTYDFKENAVCTLNVPAGANTIELVAAVGGYTVDYMLLVPVGKKTSGEKTIGVPSYAFDCEDAAQRYEAERGERRGAIAVYDEGVSGGFYMLNTEKDDRVSFFIESESDARTELAVSINNRGNVERLKDLCQITVNGKQLGANPALSGGGKFFEVTLGEIDVVRGLNEIKVSGAGANYYLDYIVLNPNINYSPNKHTIRYEAESGRLSGDCRVESNVGVSGGADVGYNYVGTSVELTVSSAVEHTANLSVCMSYTGELSVLGEVIAVSLNGRALSLDEATIENTGGYEYYREFYIGKISVVKGENTVTVTSVSGDYNLDYITLSHAELGAKGGTVKLEAENAALSDGCQSEHNVEASGGADVGFNVRNSSINFAVRSDSDLTVKLILSLSFVDSEDGLMSDYFTIKVNGKSLDIHDMIISSTGSWTVFTENIVGEMQLKEGFNTISIVSKNGMYNVDYILIQPLE
ncbi:MAG: hypothetical protein J1G38_00670 [Clostridiales bacterium]|nr:hypothetical protein [Clostridiales bacterium]